MNKVKLSATLQNLLKMCEQDDEFAQDFGLEFDAFLDDLNCDDFFGTEGQNDPRGDKRR